jgi:hypothetical protein
MMREYVAAKGPAQRPWNLLAALGAEVESGAARVGGKANPSAARTLLRLLWCADFIAALAAALVEPGDAELSACASKAYGATLAGHHPWVVRAAVYAGLKLCPYRAAFLASVAEGRDAPALRAAFASLHDAIAPVSAHLWAFYKAHALTDLP